jgi:signal transduction histidine kinase
MDRTARRRSLRRKIQNAIFRSTFISHIILACILIPALLALLIPIGQIMTRGVAIKIVQRSAMFDVNKTQKAQINAKNLTQLTEETLIKQAIQVNALKKSTLLTQDKLIALEDSFFSIPSLMVDPSTTDIKHLILISSEQYQNSNAFFDKQISFLKPYTLDFQIKQHAFFLPDMALKPDTTHKNLLEKYIENTQVAVLVTDMNSIPIGHITVGINPNVVNILVLPYLFLMLIVSLSTLLIVSLLGKFMTAGILKPLNNLNNQLQAMAKGDLESLSCTPLVVKKAPTEIHLLIQNANQILVHMMDNNALLESQNIELLTQNEELTATKEIIQKQQNMLVQTEKMASIGQLAAAIVHEINTPVGAIKSNAQMVEMLSAQLSKQELTEAQVKPLEKIKMLNGIILQASDRVSAIIKSLKSYSRLDQSDFKVSNLNEDLQNVLLLTSNLWKNRIQIIEQFGDIPLVKCYSGLLNQVFMNLVVNAIDAMEDGGTLTLLTTSDTNFVIISIKDTGTGILPENISRIFEEGFTTKSKNKGSGLGLALSKDVIQKHNGRIDVHSEIGVGSTFSVYLPLNSDQT